MDDLVYAYWFSDDPVGRWDYMYEAQQIMADDRPFITLAGQNSIQAYRNDRFEFPLDTCDVSFNMFDPEGLLQAKVK
jgi:ABC-type transport system substrate-binding protein